MNDIISLYAYVGGHGGPSYEVEIDFLSNTYTYKAYGDGIQYQPMDSEGEGNGELTFEKRQTLMKELQEINIHKWKSSYQNEHILDGTQWHVMVTTSKMKYEFEGSNAYPKQWDRFCKMIEQVVEKEFR